MEREASKNIEENERECFKDAIVSSRSLNKGFVESTKLKNAIPEVRVSPRLTKIFLNTHETAMKFLIELITSLDRRLLHIRVFPHIRGLEHGVLGDPHSSLGGRGRGTARDSKANVLDR